MDEPVRGPYSNKLSDNQNLSRKSTFSRKVLVLN